MFSKLFPKSAALPVSSNPPGAASSVPPQNAASLDNLVIGSPVRHSSPSSFGLTVASIMESVADIWLPGSCGDGADGADASALQLVALAVQACKAVSSNSVRDAEHSEAPVFAEILRSSQVNSPYLVLHAIAILFLLACEVIIP